MFYSFKRSKLFMLPILYFNKVYLIKQNKIKYIKN